MKTQDLIPTLLSFLSRDHPDSVQTSAGDFLKAIITISANATQNDQSCIGPNSLTRQMVSMPCIESLIQAMLLGGNPLTVGVGIVIEVIRKNNSDYDPENINGPETMPSTYDPIYLGNLLRLFAKHIPDFMALIQSSRHTVKDGGDVKSVERGQLSSAWGAKIEPLGFDRFKTCELMAELLHCSNMGLLNEPGSDEYVEQRDAERERLAREGAFNLHQEETSVFDGNDSTTDFVNGSVIGYGSPEGSKITAGEDGFDEVSSSGVLIDKEKDAGVPGAASGESQSERTPAVAEASPAAGADPSIKEPKPAVPAISTPGPSQTPPSDPLSPSTLGLTDRIGEVSLNSQTGLEEPKATSAVSSGELAESLQSDPSQSSAPMSSNPEAVPAPLFSASQQGQQETPHPDAADAQNNAAQMQQMHPDVQVDTNGQPVVGDYLKIMFVENRVVPTILVSIAPLRKIPGIVS